LHICAFPYSLSLNVTRKQQHKSENKALKSESESETEVEHNSETNIITIFKKAKGEGRKYSSWDKTKRVRSALAFIEKSLLVTFRR